MWKLQKLVEEKEKAEQAAAAKKEAAPAADGAAAPTPAPQTEGEFKVKRSNSKELAEERKAKAKDNVFRIGGAKKPRGGGRSQVQSCELRVQADLAELDPEATPGVNVAWPDEKNLLKMNVDVIPADGLYKGASFTFEVEVLLLLDPRFDSSILSHFSCYFIYLYFELDATPAPTPRFQASAFLGMSCSRVAALPFHRPFLSF